MQNATGRGERGGFFWSGGLAGGYTEEVKLRLPGESESRPAA